MRSLPRPAAPVGLRVADLVRAGAWASPGAGGCGCGCGSDGVCCDSAEGVETRAALLRSSRGGDGVGRRAGGAGEAGVRTLGDLVGDLEASEGGVGLAAAPEAFGTSDDFSSAEAVARADDEEAQAAWEEGEKRGKGAAKWGDIGVRGGEWTRRVAASLQSLRELADKVGVPKDDTFALFRELTGETVPVSVSSSVSARSARFRCDTPLQESFTASAARWEAVAMGAGLRVSVGSVRACVRVRVGAARSSETSSARVMANQKPSGPA